MRGKLVVFYGALSEIGITPADAGKTPAKTQERHAREDHPRGCGENIGNSFAHFLRKGSPPRMRGKPLPRRIVINSSWITPADAGKT